uniref:Uncharacterized protein n=1 Tax=Wuchereria bancrofti TaxID=6293 RepID=A0AAF5PVW0_WUCBA
MKFAVKRQDASPEDRTRSSTFECITIAPRPPTMFADFVYLKLLSDGKFSLQTSACLYYITFYEHFKLPSKPFLFF